MSKSGFAIRRTWNVEKALKKIACMASKRKKEDRNTNEKINSQ